MKKKKNSKKIVGALLALTMCISSMGASVSAMGMETEHMKEEVYVEGQNPEAVSESEENVSEQSDQTRTILRFQNLTEEVAFQSVMQGTSQEKLNLPEMLEAEDAANNKITVPVIWEAEPSFDGNTAGEYLFLPVLEEEYEMADGEVFPQIHVTVTAEETQEVPEKPEISESPEVPESPEVSEEPEAPGTHTTPNSPENVDGESKEEKKDENVTVTGLQLLGVGSTGNNVTVGLTGNAAFSVSTTLGGSAETVWLGYRFILPERSPSGGTYEFDAGSYSWLSDLNGGLPTVKKENGNLILEGKVEATGDGKPIAPGTYRPSIIVDVKDLVSDEEAILKAECWLLENEEKKVSTTATITAQGSSEYSPVFSNGGNAVVSGYFNQKTGDFSISKPKDANGYAYGRVYSVIPRAWADTNTERLDPTEPLEFNFSYYVTKTVDGKETPEEEKAYQPVLMGIKRDDKEVKESQLKGTPPIDGFTLGNIIEDGSGTSGPGSVSFYHGGEYTFTQNTPGTVHVSAILSPNEKNSGYRHVSAYGLIFVPLNENDDKSVQRNLHLKIDQMTGTAYSGNPIQVKNEPLEKTIKVPIKGGGIDIADGLFSRENYANGYVAQKGGTVTNTCVVSTQHADFISDYSVNAINILMKFEAGLELTKPAYEIEKSISSNYSGDYHFLYGLKPDGKDWSNEYELNHTEDDGLVYYDDYNTAKEKGKIVAVLAELRGGIWLSGARMMFRGEFEAVGDSGSSQVIVQDIKIWRGNEPYTTSWVGTNGSSVSHDTEPMDDMFPYDNPDNDTGVYRRDVWIDGKDKPEAVEKGIWGETVFIVGGAVRSLKKESVNLNGKNISTALGPFSQRWSNSTFDTSLNQRIVDRVFEFKVEGSEGKELTFRANLDGTENGYKDYVKQTGAVYLSTPENPVTYTKNQNETQQGTFTGGRMIDPDEFTVSGDGTYAIYYSGYIGSAEDLAADAPTGTQWNRTNLELLKDTPRYVRAIDGVRNSYATTVVRTSNESVDMISISEVGIDQAGYVFSMTSAKDKIDNIFMLDVLPYNEDGRGSAFHGSYSLFNDEIKVGYQGGENGTIQSKVRVYYTEDPGIRTADSGTCANAKIFNSLECSALGKNFTTENINWTLAEEKADQIWKLPENSRPTAVVVCGTIGKNERITASLTLALTGQKVGDTYSNITSNRIGRIETPIESETATVTIMGRNLSGKAWQDQNQNGKLDDQDTVLENVEVQLFQSDGTPITADAMGEPYEKVMTGADGSYSFERVPESTEGYYIQFGSAAGSSLVNYQTIAPNSTGAPYDKEDDSDVEFQTSPQNVVKTGNFRLLTDKELTTGQIVQRAKGINAGFEKLSVIQAEKIWRGKAESEKKITVQLQRRKDETSSWENLGDPVGLSDENSWKTSFENQLVFYKDSEIERYQYRIVESDENGNVAEDGTDITLNNNQYRVNYEETETNNWEITNSRLVDLIIENEVAGDFGDRTKEFTLDITANDKNKPLNGTFTCEGLADTEQITFQDGKGQITVAHGQTVSIKELPADTEILIVVQPTDGYKTTYQINGGDEQGNANLSLTQKESTVKVINTRADIPETGIFHNPTISGIIVFVGICGIAFGGIVILRKRRGAR